MFGIVQQSGGRIAVASAVGTGTTFHIDLPLAGAPARPPPDPPPQRAAGATSASVAETVLLVADEDTIRMLAFHALQAAGYTVLDAENGDQALRVVQSFGVPIRLLVTDVVMPGLGGRELAARLQVAQPWIEVLYMSGYTDDEVLRHGVESDQVHFLQKPFPLAALTQRVRELLSLSEWPRPQSGA